MRFSVVVLLSVLALSGSMVAGPDEQAALIDTLIIEPGDAGDLPEAVVRWLETRDLLIPLSWEEGLPNARQDSNTVVGSFIAEGQQDYAVLTVSGSAIDDSCKLWVFPESDTLSPTLLGNFCAKTQMWPTQWAPTHGKESQLRYCWRISSFSPQYYINRLKSRTVDADALPELTHDGIRLWIMDKQFGRFFYYDGENWIQKEYLDPH